MRFDKHFVEGVFSEAAIIQAHFPDDASFCIDTRSLKPGDIFVALQGETCDGHDFVADALAYGAAGIIIADAKRDLLKKIPVALLAHKLIIAVPDTLQGLIRLAAVWRSHFTYPVVAITGSVGKTSTKTMLANILEVYGMSHLVSAGNLNTKIGIALTLLRMRSYHKAAIVEVGISKRGEMAALAQLLRPTTAIITKIGHSHMEGLGSLNDIALEKRDIFKFFSEDSIGIVNGDQPILAQVSYVHPMIKFGSKSTNQIQARKVSLGNQQVSFILKIYKNKYPVTLYNAHEGAIGNALAAASAAYLLGVPSEVILKGIQMPLQVSGRFELKKLKTAKGMIVNDCYNASPESMKAALLAFQKMETNGRKIAVLGDMLELGMNGPFWHRQIGRFLRKVPSLNQVILVGSMVQWTKKTLPMGMKATIVPTWQDAVKELEGMLGDESCVLVKGSNGVGLLNLVRAVAE